jgi:hypothetical protein
MTEEAQAGGGLGTAGAASEQPGGSSFLQDLLSTSYTVQPPGTGEMRHGTEGWRSLETSFKVCPDSLRFAVFFYAEISSGEGLATPAQIARLQAAFKHNGFATLFCIVWVVSFSGRRSCRLDG